jgi:hypothetical protein
MSDYPISYVRGLSWVPDSEAVDDTFYKVTTAENGDTFPDKMWLRGIAYSQFGLETGSNVDAVVSVWNGDNGTELIRFHSGFFIQGDSAILPEDCYWNIDDSIYVRGTGSVQARTEAMLQGARFTFFFSA